MQLKGGHLGYSKVSGFSPRPKAEDSVALAPCPAPGRVHWPGIKCDEMIYLWYEIMYYKLVILYYQKGLMENFITLDSFEAI
jgi:hypothetical protein